MVAAWSQFFLRPGYVKRSRPVRNKTKNPKQTRQTMVAEVNSFDVQDTSYGTTTASVTMHAKIHIIIIIIITIIKVLLLILLLY